MKNVYLCAQFGRQSELQNYRSDLRYIGIETTSRWLDEKPVSFEEAKSVKHNEIDLEDIKRADSLIFFCGPPWCGDIQEAARGGRMFELGAAFILGKDIIIIGEPESSFQKFDSMVNFASWSQFMFHALDNLIWMNIDK